MSGAGQQPGLPRLETGIANLEAILSEHGLSPLADNSLMARYEPVEGLLVPMLRVVKTRGSGHDEATHRITLGPGGLRLGSGTEPAPPPSKEAAKKKSHLGFKRGRRK